MRLLALLLLLAQFAGGGRLTGVNVAVNITVPTSSSTYDAGTASTITVSGNAASDRTITTCTWTNSLGGSGTTAGTTSWTIASVSLTVGSNVVTVTCVNAEGTSSPKTITITRSSTPPPPPSTTPVDAILTFTNGTPAAVGTTISPSVLAAGVIGTLSNPWDNTTGTAGNLTVGAHNPLCTLNTSVSIGSTTYAPGLTSNAFRNSNGSNFTYTAAHFPTGHPKVSVAGCVTFATPVTNLHDLWVFSGNGTGGLCEMQLRNSNQLNIECIVGGNTTHSSGFISIPANQTTYWCSFMVDPGNSLGASGPQAYLACYNPIPPFSQVGSTLTLAMEGTGVWGTSTTRMRLGNAEVGTAASATSHEMLLWDYTNGAFPLGVGTLDTEWAGVLSPNRATDWATAGAGTIPARTTICTTLGTAGQSSSFAQPVTAAQINSAISGCGSEQTVKLNPGTYTVGPIIFTGKNNVTLRGSGADQTILVSTGITGVPCTDSASGGAFICMSATDNNYYGGKSNSATWSAGYLRGSNVVTLSSVSNLRIGGILMLDQLDESCDVGSVIVTDSTSTCTPTSPGISGPYSLEGNGGTYHVDGRQSLTLVQVTGCNGNTATGTLCTGTNTPVTIDPPIRWPHYRSGQSPQAWWPTNPIHDDGLEDLTVDMGTNTVSGSGVQIKNGHHNWLKGVAIITTRRAHLQLVYGFRNTFRDSYLFLTQAAATQSYGYDCLPGGDNLVENNIFHAIEGSIKENGCMGDVIAYNFSVNQYYTASARWNQPCLSEHTAGTGFNLYEGNICNGFETDVFHGTHFFATTFRNWLMGVQPACYVSGSSYSTSTYGACNNNMHAYRNEAFSRFFNHIGNVLGSINGTFSYAGSQPNIFELGFGNTETITVPDDTTNVPGTLMRWGNYDTATASTRFQSAEVPSGLTGVQALFSNSVPASQTLPSSFYLSARPSWWTVSIPWPPIGPDVTAGNAAPGIGGHANKTPAYECYTSLGGLNDGTGPRLTNFNAATCYP